MADTSVEQPTPIAADVPPVTAAETELIVEEAEEEVMEDEAHVAPEDLLAEEQKLMEERRNAQEQAQSTDVEVSLSAKRFSQLDQLLDQTNLYSKFLSEQMESLAQGDEGEGDGDGAGAGADEADAGKRKGKAAAGGGKKAKTEDSKKTPTERELPLVTGGELRPYQLKGVRWLVSLYQNGLNGILADQMGLGKTVQVVSFLSHLRSKGVMGPYLVVGPLSTLPNWVNEFKRWTPDVPVLLYHGSQAERAQLRHEHLPLRPNVDADFPVICTSFEIIIRDRKFLQGYTFKYLVVDEGHRLKNFDCMLIRELKLLKTNNKLLLSGTPLQNNLAELWSLLHFILPDVFSNLEQFQSWFDFSSNVNPDQSQVEQEAEKRQRVVQKLHSILRPFLLRRIKSDVETSLPRKKEIILYASMTPKQHEVARALMDRNMGAFVEKAANGAPVKSTPQLNNVLMQLRKNCNHPDLITSQMDGSMEYPSAEELVAQCGKFRLMDRLLTQLKAKGHKVLIFSQMTRMLDLISVYLESKGEKPFRIDGTVPWQERQEHMKLFNEDPNYFVFLLSTRAGGLGINLVAADTVIIYDSDWNPHQDLQAMDRVHRIGQQRPVHVYRLATAHSVEGRMLARATEKLKLEKVIITGGNFKQNSDDRSALSAKDLLELITQDETKDGEAQSAEVSDADLQKVMCRLDLEGKKAPYPMVGPGWEVVVDGSSSSLLGGVA